MQNSINFLHNENKILTTFDNMFYVKNNNTWERVKNINIHKGTDVPKESLGENGDYYIDYEETGNSLIYSEDFTGEGWFNSNNNFIKSGLIFPNSESSKIIPNLVESEHSISYMWLNEIYTKINDWCFSIYVKPNEMGNFQLIMSDSSESYGVKMTVSIVLNTRKKYVKTVTFEEFGNAPSGELVYDDNSYGLIDYGDYYRAYISCKFLSTSTLKFKFKLLKNVSGELVDIFKNNNDTNGLFINSAQLSKSKLPVEYVISNGFPFYYMKFNSIYKKENDIWNKLEDYNSVWYGNDEPKESLGINGDLYFHNPIIKVGEFVRFGKNTLFKCWKYGEIKYYTVNENPSIDDDVYSYENNVAKKVGKVLSFNQDFINKTNITVSIGNSILTLVKSSYDNTRFIKTPGVVFWNKDASTYGYIDNNGKIFNLSFNGKSLYNKDLIIQALTYSTNLFMQTWDSHYTIQPRQYQFGFNSGGHGNFLDYNRLRYYY